MKTPIQKMKESIQMLEDRHINSAMKDILIWHCDVLLTSERMEIEMAFDRGFHNGRLNPEGKETDSPELNIIVGPDYYDKKYKS